MPSVLGNEANMIDIRYVNDKLDKDFINAILAIDASVYPLNLQGTFDEVYGRFKANRDTYVLLYHNGTLIGYFCFFPIKAALYDEIAGGDKLFDSDIPGEMLEPYKVFNTYKLFVISTAILPEHQKKGLSKYLINGFFQFILDKKENNIMFSSALSSSVTPRGKIMLDKIGFTKIKAISNDYSLHELIMSDDFYRKIERARKCAISPIFI
jgi:GNAT superfamily N-acetyltransferase